MTRIRLKKMLSDLLPAGSIHEVVSIEDNCFYIKVDVWTYCIMAEDAEIVTDEPTLKTAADFANAAAKLVGGDRAKQHGDKSSNFGKTAKLWDAYLSIRRTPDTPLDGVDVTYMMVLAKMSRTHSGNRHNLDNPLDMAGYSSCAGELLAQEIELFNEAGIVTSPVVTSFASGSASFNMSPPVWLSQVPAGQKLTLGDMADILRGAGCRVEYD